MDKITFYKRKSVETTLTYFQKRFSSEPDRLGEYSHNAMLYFLPVGAGNVFIVANHFNRKRYITFQGFDLWLTRYKSSTDIGRQKAITIRSLKHGFSVLEHLSLMKAYIRPSVF